MRIIAWFAVGLVLRLTLILYGVVHDAFFVVPFTDVDYHVFTDAAKFVVGGDSPYNRATYRYPPLIAWLLTPNILFHTWGKLLFSGLDLLVAALVISVLRAQGISTKSSKGCAILWLLNPVSIIISARGNSDALVAAVVLLSLAAAIWNRPGLAGLVLGVAIHIRLYPIVFSLPIFLSFRTKRKINSLKDLVFSLSPNVAQLKLVCCCVWFLTTATAFCYFLYGDQFVNESIVYHLVRKDTRHNFSLFFYLLYLQPEQPTALLFLPQAILLLGLSVAFSRRNDLPFCLFMQSFVVVTYNPVVTSQYWIWVLSLLPACLPRLRLQLRTVTFLIVLWSIAQVAWLVPAYLLEFRGRNTFFFIWVQGIGVFCANIAIIGRLIKCYDYDTKIKPQ